MENLPTPSLVRKFASIRSRLAVLSERRVTNTPGIFGGPPIGANHPIVKRLHRELDRVVDELRRRGVLD